MSIIVLCHKKKENKSILFYYKKCYFSWDIFLSGYIFLSTFNLNLNFVSLTAYCICNYV